MVVCKALLMKSGGFEVVRGGMFVLAGVGATILSLPLASLPTSVFPSVLVVLG